MKKAEVDGSPAHPGVGRRAAALSLTLLLIQACASGDVAAVVNLVSGKNADPFASDAESGRTPLGVACEAGHIEVIRFLIERDKEGLAVRGAGGTTPLHVAARGGHIEVVKYLIDEHGMEPSCEDEEGFTPLDCAGTNKMRNFLLSRGGRGSKMYRSRRHRFTELPSLPLPETPSQALPVHELGKETTSQNQTYTLQPTMQQTLSGSSALLQASRNGDLSQVKYLVEERHVDPHSCEDEAKHSPLHLASRYGHLDIVRYLVEERNCHTECRTKYGDTPLHRAALGGRLDTVKYLINERGCDPMSRGWKGWTPLHYACLGGRLDTVKYLIEEKNVDSSCQTEGGILPLHIASSNGHLPVVKFMVEDYRCDPGVRDKSGVTAAQLAQRRGHGHISSYLFYVEKIVSTVLRRTLVDRLKPFTRKAKQTGVVLGSGRYGTVIELTSAGETVAGKVFKPTSAAQLQAVASKVCGEVMTMLQLRHPNIVQCKGVSLLVNYPLPVLLMERLMTSLHAYLLHQDNSNIPVERKVSFLLDTARGLDYLHSCTPAIIHRDLTTRNVLLDFQLTAKIADFGNSRIMDLDPNATPQTLTAIAGTLDYMPPETMGGGLKYDPSLDVFSFGHLSLFTLIQSPVRPLLPSTYTDSTTKRLTARSEVQRRKKFVKSAEQLLSESHSLLNLIKQCLHNQSALRPRTRELVTKLSEMKSTDHIGEGSLSADTHSVRDPVGTNTSETDGCSRVSENVVMGNLIRLSTAKGKHIRIIETSAVKYRDIGTILLKDDTGAIVTSIQQTALDNPVEAVRMIYERWIQENEDHSWKKLILCLRKVRLNSLAGEIEQHFTLPSPTQSQAHPSHQIIGKADETVSEDDTKRGAQTSRSSGLKRSAGSATGSPSSTRKQICTSLSQASLLQSEGGRKRKGVTQPPNEPTPKRCVSSTVEHPRRVTRSSASLKKK